jgi:cytochrome c2
MKNIVLYVLGVGLALQLVSAQGALASGTSAKILFEQKCSICHSIERPKSKVRTRKEWETTVARMRNDHDAPITADEAQKIIEYLVEHYGR